MFRICRIIRAALPRLLQFIPDAALGTLERAADLGTGVSLLAQYLNLITLVLVERNPFFLFSCTHNTASVQISKMICL